MPTANVLNRISNLIIYFNDFSRRDYDHKWMINSKTSLSKYNDVFNRASTEIKEELVRLVNEKEG